MHFADISNSSHATQRATHSLSSVIQTFSELNQSIATSPVVQLSKENLILFHEWTQLPWFAEITLITIAARCLITVPLTINQRKIFNRFQALKPEITAYAEKLKTNLQAEAYLVGSRTIQYTYRSMASERTHSLGDAS